MFLKVEYIPLIMPALVAFGLFSTTNYFNKADTFSHSNQEKMEALQKILGLYKEKCRLLGELNGCIKKLNAQADVLLDDEIIALNTQLETLNTLSPQHNFIDKTFSTEHELNQAIRLELNKLQELQGIRKQLYVELSSQEPSYARNL